MKITIDFEPQVEWEGDWEIGSHFAEYGEAYTDDNGDPLEPDTCVQATVWGPRGECLASLGCIDDADDGYRAVIAADLLAEAADELRKLYPA